jgi:hypothetical protein
MYKIRAALKDFPIRHERGADVCKLYSCFVHFAPAAPCVLWESAGRHAALSLLLTTQPMQTCTCSPFQCEGSCVFAAVEDGDVELSRALLEQLPTALINTIGPEGDTLLHIACLYAHEACVKLLLEHSASIDVRDDDNSSVLHDSAAGGCDSTDTRAPHNSNLPAFLYTSCMSCLCFLAPFMAPPSCKSPSPACVAGT